MAEKEFFFNHLPKLYEAMKKDGKELEARDLLKDLFSSNFKQDLNDRVDRFLEVPDVGFIPADEDYFKLYSELIQLYLSGFYYSTIVLAGVLCERICFDIIAKQEIKIGPSLTLSSDQKSHLFDMNLANLIELLNEWDLIKEPTKKEMMRVKDKRNEYVHPKKSKTTSKKDALSLIKKISTIIENEISINALPMFRIRESD